jgi:hypothetical protein
MLLSIPWMLFFGLGFLFFIPAFAKYKELKDGN